jgi:hypothetical protein
MKTPWRTELREVRLDNVNNTIRFYKTRVECRVVPLDRFNLRQIVAWLRGAPLDERKHQKDT